MRILVCPPDFFSVDYVINPWMDGHVGSVDQKRAHSQWSALVDRYSETAQIEVIAAAEGCPDMCFTANAGLVAEEQAVPARFRMPERSSEEEPFAEYFRAAGFTLRDLPDEAAFEGEGDALFAPGEPLLWAGYGVRSALETHPPLGETFGAEVVSLRLVDPRFYHLDTCFAPLPEGRLLYYPPAFDERSQRVIESRVPKESRIEVSEEDALGFACNVMRIEDRLFLNQASPDLQRTLAAWGYETIVVPVDEFLKAGGGVKCLSLILDQAPYTRLATTRSQISSTDIQIKGHLLDEGELNQTLDAITEAGGSFRLSHLSLAERKDQESRAELRVIAPTQADLEAILKRLES